MAEGTGIVGGAVISATSWADLVEPIVSIIAGMVAIIWGLIKIAEWIKEKKRYGP